MLPGSGIAGCYWIGDFGVGSKRITFIASRSIISGIRGAMFSFQWADS